MCKFCDDYCLDKYLNEGRELGANREYRRYASLVSVIWNKEYRWAQGTITSRKRKLTYCPSCGVRFGSKEFHKYYKEWLKKNTTR